MPPQHEELDNFTKDLTNLVRNTKFCKQLDVFPEKNKKRYNQMKQFT